MQRQEKLEYDDMETIFDEEYIRKHFDDGTYGIVELAILKSLYKYVFLDKKTLSEAVNGILKPKLQKPDYSRNINNLIGIAISKIEYSDPGAGKKVAEITVYHLTTPAHDFIKGKYPKYKHYMRKKKRALTMYDQSYIKERLLVNRWHLHMLTQYRCKKDIYCGKKTFTAGTISIPSYVYIDEYEKLIVIAVAYPREGADFSHREKLFYEKIREVRKVTTYSVSEKILLVILCHSTHDIDAAAGLLDYIGQGIVYVTEPDIVKDQGLQRAFDCTQREDGSIEKKFLSVSLRKSEI